MEGIAGGREGSNEEKVGLEGRAAGREESIEEKVGLEGRAGGRKGESKTLRKVIYEGCNIHIYGRICQS